MSAHRNLLSPVHNPRPSLIRSRRRLTSGLAGLTLAGSFLLTSPAAAGAQELPDECTADAGTVTCAFVFTGDTQEFTVPEGVPSLDVTALGANGGKDAYRRAGRGAVVTSTLDVEAGTSLVVMVGGVGGDDVGGAVANGGFNGGGNGGTPEGDATGGAGGGGASDVRTDATDLNTRLVVAGGGGGAAYFQIGGDAGQDGNGADDRGGKAGEAAAGGLGGHSDVNVAADGQAGSLGVGGAGGDSLTADRGSGAGGGGGLYGGGGGAGHDGEVEVGSGGGGSSLGEVVRLAGVNESPSITIVFADPEWVEPCSGSLCDLMGSIENLFGN